ncbi:MAG: hypothetical protein AAF960_09715 [Bacteroidota bacterium]
MVFILDEYEDGTHGWWWRILSMVIMSPIFVVGAYGMLRGIYDVFLVREPAFQRYVGKAEKDSAKGCISAMVIVAFCFLMIVIAYLFEH